MEQHECTQGDKITDLQIKNGEVLSLMKGIVKEFYGNGQEGISKTIPKLMMSVENNTAAIAAQTVVIADLVTFQATLQAIDHYKDKEALSTRQRAGIIISGIIGFCAIVTSVILKLL
jgi:hypothetical protein